MEHIEQYFEIPEFVKKASAEELDPFAEDAVQVGGFRLDTRAGVWKAAATTRIPGATIDEAVRDKIGQAFELFFPEGDAAFGRQAYTGPKNTILVKTASHEFSADIVDEASYTESVRTVLDSVQELPPAFVRKCASELLEVGDANSYETDAESSCLLWKLAGYGHVDKDAIVREATERVKVAERAGLPKFASEMLGLASHFENMVDAPGYMQATTSLDAFNIFDSVIKKANEDYSPIPPEYAVYMTPEENLKKIASEDIKLYGGSVKRGTFMDTKKQDTMRKWASAVAVDIADNAVADDYITAVKALPRVLQVEFVERFGN